MAVNSTKQEAARTGAAVSIPWGGPQQQRYYLPTGEEKYGIPSMVGNIHGNYRDANLDKGWSLSMPTELKVACPGCSKWHDTQEEVDACVDIKDAQIARWQKEDDDARAEPGNPDVDERLDKLEEGLSDIKTLLQQALGVKDG